MAVGEIDCTQTNAYSLQETGAAEPQRSRLLTDGLPVGQAHTYSFLISAMKLQEGNVFSLSVNHPHPRHQAPVLPVHPVQEPGPLCTGLQFCSHSRSAQGPQKCPNLFIMKMVSRLRLAPFWNAFFS